MLAETFINPLNLPNLLTPFRYNLEIQYVIFSILFVSLLGYVLFTFLDYMGFLDKMLVILGVFIVLLFLFLVIKERDKLDELRLQEEAVSMEEELLKIDRDIKLKNKLKKDAQQGIIYDKNDQRIDTGKPDLAKVKNFQDDINKMRERKKEIEDKKRGFDSTFLSEAKDYVLKSTESEMAQLQKDNEKLEKELRYSSGLGMEELDKLVDQRNNLDSEITDLQTKIYNEKDTDKKKQLQKKLNGKIEVRENKTEEINNLDEENSEIQVNARDRVRVDKIRKKLRENTSRQKEIGGLANRKDHYLLQEEELRKAEEKERTKRQEYENILEQLKRNEDDADLKKQLRDKFGKLVESQQELSKLGNIRKLNIGNESVVNAERLINNYDTQTDSATISNKARVLDAFNVLENLDEDATKAGILAKSSVQMLELKRALELKNLDRQKEIVLENLQTKYPDADISDIEEKLNTATEAEATTEQKSVALLATASNYVAKKSSGIVGDPGNLVDKAPILTQLQGRDYEKAVVDFYAKELADTVPEGADPDATIQAALDSAVGLMDVSKKAKWASPNEAYKKTYSSILPQDKEASLGKIREEVLGEDGKLSDSYKNATLKREDRYEVTKDTLTKLLRDNSDKVIDFQDTFKTGRVQLNGGVMTLDELKNLATIAKKQVDTRKPYSQEDVQYKDQVDKLYNNLQQIDPVGLNNGIPDLGTLSTAPLPRPRAA